MLSTSNLTISMSLRVFWNCSSVSPGKPTMASAVTAASGSFSRMRLTTSMYFSTV